jgi:hypothetical protein
MAKDPLKPPIPDMLFHTIPGKPVNPAYFEAAGLLADALFGSRPKPQEPVVSMSVYYAALKKKTEAADYWRQRTLQANEIYFEAASTATAFRELAADLTFGGHSYPPRKGNAQWDEFYAKFRKISQRRAAARQAGHPENVLLPSIPVAPIPPIYENVVSDYARTTRYPNITLKAYNESLSAWANTVQSWIRSAEREEGVNRETFDNAMVWREIAIDLAFKGQPYPEKGTPSRNIFCAQYTKIYARKFAAHKAGHKEDDCLV